MRRPRCTCTGDWLACSSSTRPDGPQLPHAYGVDDIPLIVQDKRFNDDGRVDSGTFGFLGDRILINGTHDPYLEVSADLVRFRLLNASNARVYRIGFADNRTFHAVGTDGGLLARPTETDRVKLSPGERAEIVVRFTAGEQIVMNSVGENSQEANDIEQDNFDLVRITAAKQLTASPSLPQRLGGTAAVSPPAGARTRKFVLTGSEINAKDMDMTRIDEVVPAGAHEIWEIENTTYAHNFHIHEVAFRILDVNGTPPPAYQRGPKDTVFAPSRPRYGWRFSSGTSPTRPRRTCITATSCGTRTRA